MNITWSELAAYLQGLAGLAAALLILVLAPKSDGMWQTLLVVGALVTGAGVTALLHLLMVPLL